MEVRRVATRTATIAVLVVGLQMLIGTASDQPASEPATGSVTRVELLPDLQMGGLYGMRIATEPNGRHRLRFGTIGWNVGDGPLEARGARVDPNDMVMRVTQRIYRSDGTKRDRISPAVMIHDTGDNHNHWHTRQFMTVQLYARGQPTRGVYGLRKIGYCLLDAARHPNPPPNAPAERGYPNGSCGSMSSQSVVTGLSVGYGDDYPPRYAHQWMDVSELRPGVYRICATVDPLGEFAEKVETNNQRYTDVRIDVQSGTVTRLGAKTARCGPNVP